MNALLALAHPWFPESVIRISGFADMKGDTFKTGFASLHIIVYQPHNLKVG
jgi:hypothetical protein